MFFREEVATDGLVIVLDQSISTQAVANLRNLETNNDREIVFLEDIQLAIGLEETLEKVSSSGALFVFSGNGSNYPRRLSQVCKKAFGIGVKAKRFWVPGKDPEVQVDLIYPEKFLVLGVKNIVVIDDVISSGLTLRRIYEKNAWRFPGTKWQAHAWISQVISSGKIRGYEEVSVACLVRKVTGTQKVPINSLSTLRQNSEVAGSYARRYFREPKKFLRIMGH